MSSFIATCARNANAQDVAVRLDYEVHLGCPDVAAFVAEVQKRSSRFYVPALGEPARRVIVRVRAEGDESRGTVEFRDGTQARSLSGNTCEAVVSGLALIVALTVNALPLPRPRDESQPTSARGSKPRAATTTPPPPKQSRGAKFALGLGTLAELNGWTMPSPAPFVGVFTAVERDGRGVELGELALLHGRSGRALGQRQAWFELTTARVAACPLATTVVPSVGVGLCLTLEAGRLVGGGTNSAALNPVSSSAIFWAAMVTQAKLRWLFRKRLSLAATADLAFPLVRHEFRFLGPTQTVFEIPALGLGAGLAVGVHFL